MPFNKKNWTDREVEYPGRKTMTDISGNIQQVTLSRDEGEVVVAGDKFDAATMNDLENRISSAFDYTVVNVTLSTTWSSGTQTISDSHIDPNKEITIGYPLTITDAQWTALQRANIRPTAVSSGSIKLKAGGEVPSVAIPLQLVIRG